MKEKIKKLVNLISTDQKEKLVEVLFSAANSDFTDFSEIESIVAEGSVVSLAVGHGKTVVEATEKAILQSELSDTKKVMLFAKCNEVIKLTELDSAICALKEKLSENVLVYFALNTKNNCDGVEVNLISVT